MPTYVEEPRLIAEAGIDATTNELAWIIAEAMVVATDDHRVPVVSGRLRRARSQVRIRTA